MNQAIILANFVLTFLPKIVLLQQASAAANQCAYGMLPSLVVTSYIISVAS